VFRRGSIAHLRAAKWAFLNTASVEFDSRAGWRTALLNINANQLRRFLGWYRLQNVLHRVALPMRALKGRDHLEREWTMGLIVILIILILLFGGGGFYAGAPYHYYGGGLSLVLVVLLVVLLLRR
jgi:hypothetical protein